MIDLGSRACPLEHEGSPGVNKLWVYDEKLPRHNNEPRNRLNSATTWQNLHFDTLAEFALLSNLLDLLHQRLVWSASLHETVNPIRHYHLYIYQPESHQLSHKNLSDSLKDKRTHRSDVGLIKIILPRAYGLMPKMTRMAPSIVVKSFPSE